ncbi:MAG: hypothetical protein Q9225_000340 [Loekoesia sp. 1 TL-2023]
MSGPEGFLVTRSGRRLSRKLFLKPDTFPFLRLPGEVRNMIYRFALGHGAVRKHCEHPLGLIGIENMDPFEYNDYTTSSHPRSRTSYPTMNFIDPIPCCPDHRHLDFENTTYTLGPMKLPNLGLLAVNKQIRAEALPIFYGENIFSFGQMSAVRPFLKDRPAIARQNLQHIQLFLDLRYKDGHHRERQSGWIRVFKYLAHHLNIKKLDIIVCDMTLNFLKPLKFVGWKKEWVRALPIINDLDHFTFGIDFLSRESYVESVLSDLDEDEFDDEMEELEWWMMETECAYESYFRSRMLKKTQSSIDEWLEEHTCSPQCDKVRQGRKATKQELPRSTTHGLWTLPEVDLDALYDPVDLDEPQEEEEYSDTDEWTDDDGDEHEDDGGAS